MSNSFRTRLERNVFITFNISKETFKYKLKSKLYEALQII